MRRSRVDTSNCADSFGSFLASVQSDFNPGPASYKLVALLSETGPTRLPEFMSASGMPFDEFASGLHSLQAAGVVHFLPTENGVQMVALTQAGEDLARARDGRF